MASVKAKCGAGIQLDSAIAIEFVATGLANAQIIDTQVMLSSQIGECEVTQARSRQATCLAVLRTAARGTPRILYTNGIKERIRVTEQLPAPLEGERARPMRLQSAAKYRAACLGGLRAAETCAQH